MSAGESASARIVPSVLPTDFARLGHDCQRLEKAGVDRIQWDVMDGHFVPNLTFGPDVIAACRRVVELPFEAHLMVSNPDAMLDRWVEAGCELVIVHAEACTHLHRTLGAIAELGARAGVALNPATPVEAVAHVLDLIDLALVMTVNPGFGGQRYIASMEPKIAALRQLIDASGYAIELEVDGGIGPDTIVGAARAGATTFCSGSSLFATPGGLEAGVAELRRLATEAMR
ncbi:MAG: ribulose-phosphate 3-epimerase [Egibacteraceae bacterium]